MSRTKLPPSVVADLGKLPAALSDVGFTPQSCKYSPTDFGNFTVVFGSGNRSFLLSRDRGQFIVGGERGALEPAGLFRSFDSVASLHQPLLAWLKAQNVA